MHLLELLGTGDSPNNYYHFPVHMPCLDLGYFFFNPASHWHFSFTNAFVHSCYFGPLSLSLPPYLDNVLKNSYYMTIKFILMKLKHWPCTRQKIKIN